MLARVGRLAIFVLVFLVCGLAVRVLFVDPQKPDEIELQAAPKPRPPAPPQELAPPAQATAPDAEVDPLFLPKPKSEVIDFDPDLDRPSEPIECEPSAPPVPLPAEGGGEPRGPG